MSNKSVNMISRNKFLLWGTAMLAAIGLFKILKPLNKKIPETAKFLTEDGQLVEVDKKHTESRGVKIYTSELKDWIKK